jgi:hypothetical protein
VFAFVLTTLKETKFHIRLALVNLNWIIQGTHGPDAFISLELQAKEKQK